jgi:hypothetical protein
MQNPKRLNPDCGGREVGTSADSTRLDRFGLARLVPSAQNLSPSKHAGHMGRVLRSLRSIEAVHYSIQVAEV